MNPTRLLSSHLAALIVALTVGAALAYAHAVLLRADPAPDSIIASAPAVVRVWFSEPIEVSADALVVIDPAGRRVSAGGGAVPDDPTALETRLTGASVVGTYTVQWKIVSEDGHPVRGAYSFSVQRVTGAAVAADVPRAHTGLLALSRGVHLAGLTLVLGALALLLLIGVQSDEAQRTLARLSVAGAIIIALAAPLMLFAQTATIEGSTAGAFGPGALARVIHSHWGALWIARMVATAALLVVLLLLLVRSRTSRPPLLGGALLCMFALLIATSLNGHAAATDPILLSIAADVVHLTATGAWLGGIIGMLALLRATQASAKQIEHKRVVDLGTMVPRFSALALICVELLLITGLYQTWAHVDGPELLATTSYGKTLVVKLALIALIAAPAALNLLVLKPRFANTRRSDTEEPQALVLRFTRMLGVEASLGALVLFAAALLSTLPPARTPPSVIAAGSISEMMQHEHNPAPARVWSARAGDEVVMLSLDPAILGSNHVVLTVRDASGAALDAGAVRLRAAAPQGSGVAASVVQLALEGKEYHATLALPAAGKWHLQVLLEAAQADFTIDVAPLPHEHARHPAEEAGS